jgi:hypothetical protein
MGTTKVLLIAGFITKFKIHVQPLFSLSYSTEHDVGDTRLSQYTGPCLKSSLKYSTITVTQKMKQLASNIGKLWVPPPSYLNKEPPEKNRRILIRLKTGIMMIYRGWYTYTVLKLASSICDWVSWNQDCCYRRILEDIF